MSVRQAQHEIDSREFAEWLAYFRLEPFGQDRQDINAGIIAASTINYSGNAKRPVKPTDCMPRFERPKKGRQSVEQMKSVVGSIKNAWDKRKKGKS